MELFFAEPDQISDNRIILDEFESKHIQYTLKKKSGEQMNLNELTVLQAKKGLQEKKFSAVELVQACLKRIRQTDGKIKAFITVCDREALKAAKEADKMIDKAQRNNR